jgi:hypothetical protein
MKFSKYLFSGVAFLTLFFAATLLINGCAIHPQAWQPPTKPPFVGELGLNEELTDISKIDLGEWNGPEEFAFDASGNMYCGVHKGEKEFSSGAILKISPEGKVEEFLKTDAWVTGLEFDDHNNLIALMNGVGLIRVDQNKNSGDNRRRGPTDPNGLRANNSKGWENIFCKYFLPKNNFVEIPE